MSIQAIKFGLENIQISIDGATREVHATTRGETFDCVMRGINSVANYLLPFSLAPTVHNGNVHEIGDIAYLAYSNDGDITPNNLRNIPGNNMEGLRLSPSNLIEALRLIGHAQRSFGLQELGKQDVRKEKSRESGSPVYRKTVCGAGRSVVAIDYKGNVFPCHVLERSEMQIGNALKDEWAAILSSAERLGVRCSSFDIPKCNSCHFATTCAGGCRADAFFHNGTFLAQDSLCETMYDLNMKTLMDLRVESFSGEKATRKFDNCSTILPPHNKPDSGDGK